MATPIEVTPPGELMWPRLLQPGPLEKKKEGRAPKTGWSVEILLPEGDQKTKSLIASIQAFFRSKHGDAARPGQNGRPWKQFLNEDDEPTGMLVFKFKANQFISEVDPATGETNRRELPGPRIEDASGAPWKPDLLIGNGSIGKVAFNMYSWSNPEGGAGVSLGLKAVRVLMHVPYESANLDGVFGEPEVGFTAQSGSSADTAPSEEVPW